MTENHAWIPAWIRELKPGDRILSIDGEISDVDFGDHVESDVHTGLNAIGTIETAEHPSAGFSVAFECGVTVLITQQEMAKGNYRWHPISEKRLAEFIQLLSDGNLTTVSESTHVTRRFELGNGCAFVVSYYEGDDPMTKIEFHDNGVSTPLSDEQGDVVWDGLI